MWNPSSNCQPPQVTPLPLLPAQSRTPIEEPRLHRQTITPRCRSLLTMSRPSVMTGGFHPHSVGHGHGHGHGLGLGLGHVHHGGHYGVHAQSAYGSAAHSGLAFGRPLPIRAPVLPPAFNNQHTGQQQHQHQHGRASTFSMADSAFMTAEEEHAYMQKLSSEYEPEATVSPASM